MPLDPQAEAFLKQAADADAPPLESLPVSQAREFLRTLFAPAGPREAIKKVEDRVVDAGGVKLPLRIFTPEGAGALPILVFFPRRMGARRSGSLRYSVPGIGEWRRMYRGLGRIPAGSRA